MGPFIQPVRLKKKKNTKVEGYSKHKKFPVENLLVSLSMKSLENNQ